MRKSVTKLNPKEKVSRATSRDLKFIVKMDWTKVDGSHSILTQNRDGKEGRRGDGVEVDASIELSSRDDHSLYFLFVFRRFFFLI